MNPIIEQALNDIRNEIDLMRNAKDLQAIENIKRSIDAIAAGVKDTSVSAITSSTADDGTRPSIYNAKVRVTIEGTDYYIGLYNT